MAIPYPVGSADADAAAIRHVVAGISTAWRARRVNELHDFFADDVVLIAPGARARIQGRAAVIETYREFAENTAAQDYRELDLSVDVFGATAVATYRYEIQWIRDGAQFREAGTDVLVLGKPTGKWKVVWRTICPDR
jgi:ketosteroid isomerase-like protein